MSSFEDPMTATDAIPDPATSGADVDPSEPAVPKRRRFPIWGWLSILAVIVAIACVIAFVVVPGISRNNNPTIDHASTKHDTRTALAWGPVVDVTQGLPDPGQNSYSFTTKTSGDFVVADVTLGPSGGNKVVSEYLRGIDARTSTIVWTLDMATLGVQSGSSASVAVDPTTGTVFLAWIQDELCYLASIRLIDGTIINHSTAGLPTPVPINPTVQLWLAQAANGIFVVSIPIDSSGIPKTQFNLYGFSAKDLDHPIWQRERSTIASFVADRWMCGFEGCWSIKNGRNAPFTTPSGADTSTGATYVFYQSYKSTGGKYRTYRITQNLTDTASYNWQQWSISNDRPAPNTQAVTWSGNFSTLSGGNIETLLLCPGSICTPVSMDGKKSYPSFQPMGTTYGIEINGALILYDTGTGKSVPNPSLLVSLASGQTTTLDLYGDCRASNDLAYCVLGVSGTWTSPLQIQAIDPSQGATPVWSSQPDQVPDANGKYDGSIGFTNTSVFFYDNSHIQFAPRF